ncbi:FHA domain-containing protein [Pseudactinotalea sp. HY160]|uniref:FHA domain-containing protein FhaB/FipA n=1 Tax=Pseudactinotalea sp. HY160 TaxID=2654490 RepID=UPI00128AF96D|nr:FHA domain-containing protein [Pseudactinotalea sp. HY160]MPV49184.1 FHA domain-containing protein [Pseudactinotalea sp. HY160]
MSNLSELVVTVLRLGFLAMLWLFVLSAIGVLRRDIFGTRIFARGSVHATRPARERAEKDDRADRSNRALGRLVVTAGPLGGTSMRLGESAILIGRDPSCTLVLDDDYSSSRHARIFPADGAWYVEDLGSTNGTFVASRRISTPVVLGAGTPIRIGQTIIELRR